MITQIDTEKFIDNVDFEEFICNKSNKREVHMYSCGNLISVAPTLNNGNVADTAILHILKHPEVLNAKKFVEYVDMVGSTLKFIEVNELDNEMVEIL